jgi:hypothetical protein
MQKSMSITGVHLAVARAGVADDEASRWDLASLSSSLIASRLAACSHSTTTAACRNLAVSARATSAASHASLTVASHASPHP